jgi:macrolide transport system ATP-binding/permease protein
LRQLQANTLEIYPGKGPGDDKAASIRTLVSGDVDALRAQAYIDSVTPVTTSGLRLRFRDVDAKADVNGVSESFFRVRNMVVTHGIGLQQFHVLRQQQVVVIDQNVVTKLFGPRVNPIGQILIVGSMPCTVIGVAEDRSNLGGQGQHLNAWIPYTTGSSRLFGQQNFNVVIVRLRDDQPIDAAENSIEKLLLLRHKTKDFFTMNIDAIFRAAEQTGQSITLLLSLIAAISLVVGGVGVMNIMLVSVTERTREIGIRMAVGARQRDVLQQFLTEAVVVCLVSGVVGIVLSYGVSFFFHQWQMIYSLNSILSAFFCATLIGVLFGFAPARNAARLNPVEALAHE